MLNNNLRRLIFKLGFKNFSYKSKLKKFKRKNENGYLFIKDLSKKVNKILKLTINVDGTENIPNNGYVTFCNHRGSYDLLLLTHLINKESSFVLDIENKKDKIQKILCDATISTYLSDDARTIANIVEDIRSGKNYILFPEGIKNDTNKLLDFKHDYIKIAMQNHSDILPIVVYGTENIFDRNVDMRYIKVSILKPITYSEYRNLTYIELSKQVQSLMQKEFDKLRK